LSRGPLLSHVVNGNETRKNNQAEATARNEPASKVAAALCRQAAWVVEAVAVAVAAENSSACVLEAVVETSRWRRRRHPSSCRRVGGGVDGGDGVPLSGRCVGGGVDCGDVFDFF
jgi:hypothetical protein